MICHPERSEGSGIYINVRDSSLRYAPFRMTTFAQGFIIIGTIGETVLRFTYNVDC
jgi:hypothetical protein